MEKINLEAKKGTPVLLMQGISKTFPGVRALVDVDLEVHEGEVHGLVGKNGAGKSTLMRILMGLDQPDAGVIQLDGRRFTSISPNEALEAGVAYVPQHASMMSSLTVAENILAGAMPKGFLGFIDWKAVYKEAADRLGRLGLDLDVRKPVEGLRVAEQTMLAIAKALFGKAKLIVLDEPTAPLPRAEINRLFGFIRSLKDKGIAFIYISHHLEEVFEICDRVTVLRDGRVVCTRNVADLDIASLTQLLAGVDVREYERKSTAQEASNALEVIGLTRRGYYENINFTVSKGEIVGITGLHGCGVEALGAGLFGLERRGVGEVFINGQPYTARNPHEALEQGLAYLPQDRYRFGLIGFRPVRENVTYAILTRLLGLFNIVKVSEEKRVAQEYIDGLGIVTPSQEQMVRLLSGGNQQKVVFAKLAATRPSVLILHEPTFGIDVRAKLDIFRIIDELSTQGVAIVIISTEVRELIGMCDRILVMYEGRIIEEFKKGHPRTTPENILRAMEGGNNRANR
jgi:ABC-type sugar transport system ATPase subunit